MILFILQNGYHSDKYDYRNLQEWSIDLYRSHTGRRLAQYVPDGAEYRVINSTPVVGENVDSCLEPDLGYIRDWIAVLKPNVICACGQIAQKACADLGLETYVKAPHPAWRRLSKQNIAEIRDILKEGDCNNDK